MRILIGSILNTGHFVDVYVYCGGDVESVGSPAATKTKEDCEEEAQDEPVLVKKMTLSREDLIVPDEDPPEVPTEKVYICF